MKREILICSSRCSKLPQPGSRSVGRGPVGCRQKERMMAAKTLIVSDLHLGNGAGYDIFAGGEALPPLLERFAAPGNTVLVNGDSIDFLMNEDPLELDEARAVAQAERSLAEPTTARVMQAFGRVLAAGAEVIIRLGNHDIELALAAVQDKVRAALQQPPAVAARLRFERGNQPALLDVGGARILVTHGEQNDPWNRVDYANLPGPEAPATADARKFTYGPGSRLVKTVMNPLKRQYGLRFVDLVKPDFQGGVLSALAVRPDAVKTLFHGSTLQIVTQFMQKKGGPVTFPEADEEAVWPSMDSAVALADLTDEERQALQRHFESEGQAPISFADGESPLDTAREKIGRAGLRLYAGAQRSLTGTEGERYFALQPTADEWNEAKRLATKYQADAVVFGHTHAARWQSAEGLVMINTGTWIWLMRLPAHNAADSEWTKFLEICRQNPRLDPSKGESIPLLTRFTAAVVEPSPAGGATLSLIEWKGSGEPTTLGQQHVPPRAAAKA